jgi:hypothetical protein
LSSVVITATKTEQDSFDLPMSIDKVSKEQIQRLVCGVFACMWMAFHCRCPTALATPAAWTWA